MPQAETSAPSTSPQNKCPQILVAALVIFVFGVVAFWAFSIFWKILKSDRAVYERNRRNVGRFFENLIGRNPITHDSHAQSRGRVFIPDDRDIKNYDQLPKGRFVDNAKLSSDYVVDIIAPR